MSEEAHCETEETTLAFVCLSIPHADPLDPRRLVLYSVGRTVSIAGEDRSRWSNYGQWEKKSGDGEVLVN